MKILIADDDKDDLFLIKEALEESNLFSDISFVNDGEELLNYLTYTRSNQITFPDVILLDINMPRLNGKQALLFIKKHPHFKNIPVVIFTTSTSKKEEKECYDLGAILYLTKPQSYEALLDMPALVEKHLKKLKQLN